MDTIYILKTIRVKEKTEDILRLDFAHLQLNSKVWVGKTFEDYKKYLKSFEEKHFLYEDEDNCYSLDLEDILTIARKNTCALDDCAYNYIAIVEVPTLKTYAIHEAVKSLHVLRYNEKLNIFEDVSLDDNDETKFIAKKIKVRD